MKKAQRGIEEVPYHFLKSSIKGSQDKKSPIFTQIGLFQTVAPVWIR